MAFIREALERLRPGYLETQRQQRTDFIDSLPLHQAENVGAMTLAINEANRRFRHERVRFNLVAERAIDVIDFLVVCDALPDTPLRKKALSFLKAELEGFFTSNGESSMSAVHQTGRHGAFDVCYGPEKTKFYFPGEDANDSYIIKSASDPNDKRYILLISPQP